MINMTSELSREIQKLEVRAKDVMNEEKLYLKAVEDCVAKFKNIKEFIETHREDLEALTKLRLEAYEALNETMKAQSKVEHEKSHLLESYGALTITVERELANLKKKAKSK